MCVPQYVCGKRYVHKETEMYRTLLVVFAIAFAHETMAHPRQIDVDLGYALSSDATHVVLQNGNTVVCDPRFSSATTRNVGAVWLIGTGGTIISRLTGSQVNDAVCGAVEDPSAGSDKFVSTNGIKVLPDGNVLIVSPEWQCASGASKCGAVTWMDGVRGLGANATVSYANSFVGSAKDDRVGSRVYALSNGDYIVQSQGKSISAASTTGALTYVKGGHSVSGTPTASTSWTDVGLDSLGGLTELPGGDLVVTNPQWSGGRGAITQIRRDVPFSGVVTSANSLTGSMPTDAVGSSGVSVLENGNYVVCSPRWNRDRGAATWVDAARSRAGEAVSVVNSLIGRLDGDQVCNGAIVPLSGNSNYVVVSFSVSGSSPAVGPMKAAVSWGRGNNGLVGEVSLLNSLFSGGATSRFVEVKALPRTGNYVVAFAGGRVADAPTGAEDPVVWADGATGVVGYPTTSNSQYGGVLSMGTGNTEVLTALKTGNYVVARPEQTIRGVSGYGTINWNDGISGGRTGDVLNDRVLAGISPYSYSVSHVFALNNGNYAISSTGYGGYVGSVTLGLGDAPIGSDPRTSRLATIPTAANSLVGGCTRDFFGGVNYFDHGNNVVPLANGNFAVAGFIRSACTSDIVNVGWTWGDGVRGTVGTSNATNTVFGPECCYTQSRFFPLADGRFVAVARSAIGTTKSTAACEYSGKGAISGGHTDSYCVFTSVRDARVAASPTGHVWSILTSHGISIVPR